MWAGFCNGLHNGRMVATIPTFKSKKKTFKSKKNSFLSRENLFLSRENSIKSNILSQNPNIRKTKSKIYIPIIK